MISVNTEDEYKELKKRLERTVEKHKYDLKHPDVVAVSKQLDKIIIRMMGTK